MRPPDTTYVGCAIPTDIYEIGMGWDPRPEVERLLALARGAGVEARRVLELGCGAGRLLAALDGRCARRVGLELSPAAADAARASGADVHVGDMSDFRFGESFDLVYASANTIRHVVEPDAVRRMWRCVREHLRPGGVFIGDLELGRAALAASCGRPAAWSLARGGIEVEVEWLATQPPDDLDPVCTIVWTFAVRSGPRAGRWSESFRLRCDDAAEFVRGAEGAGLRLAGLYELRDPYLLARPVDRASGRCLVVLQRPAA